jgi:hypothetical protein
MVFPTSIGASDLWSPPSTYMSAARRGGINKRLISGKGSSVRVNANFNKRGQLAKRTAKLLSKYVLNSTLNNLVLSEYV